MKYLTTHPAGSRSPLTEFRREMDRLFDGFWTFPGEIKSLRQADSHWSPACEIEEAEDHYLISLDMPGVPKDQINIEVQDNHLVISGERRQDSQKNQDGHRYTERRFGKFQRSFALPAGVNWEKAEANYEDGILRLHIPKAESARPRQIKINMKKEDQVA